MSTGRSVSITGEKSETTIKSDCIGMINFTNVFMSATSLSKSVCLVLPSRQS